MRNAVKVSVAWFADHDRAEAREHWPDVDGPWQPSREENAAGVTDRRSAHRGRCASRRVAPRPLDLVVLDDAPASLAYRVLRDGTRLVEVDRTAMARHREETIRRYLDLAPLRRELARGLRDRVAEGRFGR